MTSTSYESDNDYEINFLDFLTGEYISMGSGEYCSVKFDGVGSPDLREVVFNISGGDGIKFGVEQFNSITWTITGAIHSGINKNVAGAPEDAWNSWSKLARAWTAYPERLQPRAVVPLYFKRPGREQMVVFGRPNRIDPDASTSYSGYIAYTATFRQSDTKFYSATPQVFTLDIGESTTGGLEIIESSDAFTLPFRTSEAFLPATLVSNDGDAPTNPVIYIQGGITNPQLSYITKEGEVVWSIQLQTTIPDNTTVMIDTRSWARTITIPSDGTSLAGTYDGTKLQDIVIPPGEGTLQFAGNEFSTEAHSYIEFRKAWYST